MAEYNDNFLVIINNSWQDVLKGEFEKDYFKKLRDFLKKEYKIAKINPDINNIYRALELTPFESVKVVIVGQDPAPGRNQSNGVAFSAPPGADIPLSIQNIYVLLKKEFGDDWKRPSHGCLESWAAQGVLLLNSILTVRQGIVKSHEGRGWETFTDAIIEKLSEREQPTVFILWGQLALRKEKYINKKKHLIIASVHPIYGGYPGNEDSFIETTPFSDSNNWLKERGLTPIDWNVPKIEEYVFVPLFLRSKRSK